jgi:hypothetical protein
MITYQAPAVPGRLFTNIYNVLKRFLTAPILTFHCEQMSEALMYNGTIVSLDSAYNLVFVSGSHCLRSHSFKIVD